MNNYTPDEEQVREQYTREQPPQIGAVAEKRAEFDRFIAKVKADAWDEVADMAESQQFPRSAAHIRENNPYRQEAGR